ncbi:2'-5' RNA ligase family protein [Pseudoroseomonas wenyumeiae]
MTLARTDKAAPEKLISFVQAHNLFRAPPQPISHFCLYSSRLGKEQAHYVAEVDYRLEGATQSAGASEE